MQIRFQGTVLFLFLLLAGIIGCDSQPPNGVSAPENVASAPGAPAAMVSASADEATKATGTKTSAPLPRKIIYTATVAMNTNDFPQTVAKLNAAVKGSNGYIAETNVESEVGSPKSGTWKVRIPAEKFESFMASLGSIGEISTSTTSSQDVSEEFYDVAARLKNKRLEEDRLLQILRSSTGKLQEILTLEKEISRVREDIERIEGRLRFLTNQTDLTTVTITVHELQMLKHPDAPTFGTQLQRTLIDSLVALSEVAKGLLLALVGLLPWAVIGAGIGLPFFYVSRKRREQRNARERATMNTRRETVDTSKSDE